MTPCRWRDDDQSARHLLAVFAAGVKICKASRKPGRVLLGFQRQRIGEDAHLPVFSYEEQQFEQRHLAETRAQFRPEILCDVAPVLQIRDSAVGVTDQSPALSNNPSVPDGGRIELIHCYRIPP